MIVVLALASLLFLFYVHLQSQYSKSEFLDIYQIDYTTKEAFNETCDIKQPFVFYRGHAFALPRLFSENKQAVCVKDIADYRINSNLSFATSPVQNQEKEDEKKKKKKKEEEDAGICCSIDMPYNSALRLMCLDGSAEFFSEKNNLFLDEAGILDNVIRLDKELRPRYNIITTHDMLFGSMNLGTPLRYHTQSRKFIFVHEGTIRVKVASWKYTKYLKEKKDFTHYDFRSEVNVWDETEANKDRYLLENIQFLEIDISKGMILYIPPYWWYSIKYTHESTILFEYTYSSIINSLAFLGNWGQCYLQNANISYH